VHEPTGDRTGADANTFAPVSPGLARKGFTPAGPEHASTVPSAKTKKILVRQRIPMSFIFKTPYGSFAPVAYIRDIGAPAMREQRPEGIFQPGANRAQAEPARVWRSGSFGLLLNDDHSQSACGSFRSMAYRRIFRLDCDVNTRYAAVYPEVSTNGRRELAQCVTANLQENSAERNGKLI
jgi:hypothetical protein